MKGNDIGCAHARVYAGMRAEVDEAGCFRDSPDGGFDDGVVMSGKGHDAAVVVGIHFVAEQDDAGSAGNGVGNGVDDLGVAASEKFGTHSSIAYHHNVPKPPNPKAANKDQEKIKTLDRILSKAGGGVAHRGSAVDPQGRVTVDGRKALSPDAWVNPEKQKITFDGKPLQDAIPRTLLLYKPKGYITTYKDPEGAAHDLHVVAGREREGVFGRSAGFGYQRPVDRDERQRAAGTLDES